MKGGESRGQEISKADVCSVGICKVCVSVMQWGNNAEKKDSNKESYGHEEVRKQQESKEANDGYEEDESSTNLVCSYSGTYALRCRVDSFRNLSLSNLISSARGSILEFALNDASTCAIMSESE